MTDLKELYQQRDNLQQEIMNLQQKLTECETKIDQKETVEVLTKGDTVMYLSVDFPKAFVKLMEKSSPDKAFQLGNYLNQWAKAIVNQRKKQDISIEAIIPLLKKGWVAMDATGDWYWYQEEPVRNYAMYQWNETGTTECIELCSFRLERVRNWEESLRKCGL